MTSFRIFEIILYSCLNLLPYLGLALYPFADKLRFSKVKVGLFIFLLLFFQTSLGIYATTCSQGQKGMLSLISTLCYGIFYFFVVKETPGKLIFVLLIVSNFANFIVICAKWMEAHKRNCNHRNRKKSLENFVVNPGYFLFVLVSWTLF